MHTYTLSKHSFSKKELIKIKSQNCENFIGSVEIPVGLAGPVPVVFKISSTQTTTTESWHIPLATTEGALVASVNRGCKALRLSGGARVSVSKVGMSRAPVFELKDGWAVADFCDWIDAHFTEISKVCESTSSHLKLLSINHWSRGKKVFVRFVFDTDEAMGMNMVTISLAELWKSFLSKNKELKGLGLELISLSSNVCTDKKDSVMNRVFGRGYHVKVEANISEKIVKEVLHTSSDILVKTHITKNLIGSNVAGSLSQNMQVSNVAAAMFLATGQDIAHVVEASQASVTFERLDKKEDSNEPGGNNDGVYVALDLPNINVGSVGGGTWLPDQVSARSLIRGGSLEDGKENSGSDCVIKYDLKASDLAAAIGVGALAGEISGLAALSSHSLASAHSKLGRSKLYISEVSKTNKTSQFSKPFKSPKPGEKK